MCIVSFVCFLGVIVFLCFILYDATGDHFKRKMSLPAMWLYSVYSCPIVGSNYIGKVNPNKESCLIGLQPESNFFLHYFLP